ncbi:AEC family transporter [Chachezhania antarctica]|uniref:AEC family transporter n=1 Tax=Chachezhania antarctica TaxID=2340860 RepID=UPI000EB35B91|nr:AEC family transporter [Chachezhania antarctica]|tara:strand:- start:7399 stop:8325 length:927 start_codon:yes stop_codon:yes gene_type:complete
MVEIFLRTLPFFAIIGLGYGAGRARFIDEAGTALLTKFVFFFPLSALIFKFASALPVAEIFDIRLIGAYLWGTAFVYGIATAVAFIRRLDVSTAAMEAQCAVIGNVGFLGLPMFALLFGEEAIAPLMLVLTVDLIVFSSLIVILINAARSGRINPAAFRMAGMGLVKNPMIASLVIGLGWSMLDLPQPEPMRNFMDILAGAATPGALFAIGASLAGRSAERPFVAGWLSFCKLVLHPIFVAFAVLVLFPLDPFPAAIVISAAAMPVAGNVYMLAQHYGVAPVRVSTSILISTAISILTVPLVIAWVSP